MQDDEELFRQFQEGSWKAFKILFEAYSEQLYLYAAGFLGDREEARDIVQDAFVYLWENRKKITYTGSLYSYLLRSVKNSCIDYKMHEKVKEKYIREMEYLQDEAEEVSDNFEELYKRLQKVIDSLPPKCKEIFVLGCVEGYSYKEVATRLGKPLFLTARKIGAVLLNFRIQSAFFAGELFS